MQDIELSKPGARAQYILGLIVALAITVVLLAILNGDVISSEDGREPVVPPIMFFSATIIVAAITTRVVWLLTHRAYENPTRSGLGTRSLVLGILAAISALWLGVVFGIFGPICAAAVMFGLKAIAAGEKIRGYVGTVLGVLAFIISAILVVTAAFQNG